MSGTQTFPSRELNLSQSSDLDEYLDWLDKVRNKENATLSRDVFAQAVALIGKELGPAWLLVKPAIFDGGLVMVKTEKHLSVGLSFVHEVLTLGVYLLSITDTTQLQRMIHALKIEGPQRINTITEVRLAGRYARAGYPIQIEPPNDRSGKSDLKVQYFRPIHFEAKTENFNTGKDMANRTSYVKGIADTVAKATVPFLPAGYHIQIDLPKEYRKPSIPKITHAIIEALRSGKVPNEGEIQGGKFTISNSAVDPNPIRGQIKVGSLTLPSGVSMGFKDSQVFVSCPTPNIKKKFADLVTHAKKQIPKDESGVIVIRTMRPDIVADVAKDKFQIPEFANIVAIVGMGPYGSGTVERNPKHQDIPDEFFQISVRH